MRHQIQTADLPPDSYLHAYRDNGAYADCYFTEVDGAVSQASFVEAFYTTPLFKIERALLAWVARRPASDADARRLAAGGAESFSAWRVERRSEEQLLLGDFTGRTKSWLMARPSAGDAERTRLHFGSAVLPARRTGDSGRPSLGFIFRALLGFHKLYSRLLLRAASARVLARRGAGDDNLRTDVVHDLEANKRNAVAFYRMAYLGDPARAVETYVGGEYIQHNPQVGDGKQAFIDYFTDMAAQYPGKDIEFVRVIAEGDLVALHTHQTWPGDMGYVTMDFFRFDSDGKIVEHWDAIQEIPPESKNGNPMY